MVRTAREVWIGILILLVFMVLTVLPLVSMLTSALAPPGTTPIGISWPSDAHWENFTEAFRASNYLVLLQSSALIAGTTVPITVLFATMAGFAMGALHVRGGGAAMALLLLGLTLPVESIITPLYYQMRGLGLLNTQASVILSLIGVFMPFGVFWMRAHFSGMPRELTEAARVDGASSWQLFHSVHLPLAIPPMATLALLTFLWSLNAFLHPLVLIDDPQKRTLAGALGAFQGQYVTDVPLLNAGALLLVIPSLTIFLFFQRHFIRGLLQGAGK